MIILSDFQFDIQIQLNGSIHLPANGSQKEARMETIGGGLETTGSAESFAKFLWEF